MKTFKILNLEVVQPKSNGTWGICFSYEENHKFKGTSVKTEEPYTLNNFLELLEDTIEEVRKNTLKKTPKEIYQAAYEARYTTLVQTNTTDKASRLANIFAVKSTWFLFNNQDNPNAFSEAKRRFL